jgi:hypothetical protein
MTLQEFITQTEGLLTQLNDIVPLQDAYNKNVTDRAALEAMNNPPNPILTQAIAELTAQIDTQNTELLNQKAAIEVTKNLLMSENISYTT